MCMILRLTGYNEHDGVCAVGQLDDEGQRPSLQSLNIAARITFCGPDSPPVPLFIFRINETYLIQMHHEHQLYCVAFSAHAKL